MRRLLIVLLLIMFFVSACGGHREESNNAPAVSTDSISKVVDSNGGTLVTPSGNATLSVPAGALSGSATITVSQIENDETMGAMGIPYNFSPSGLTFNVPAIVTLKYDIASLPSGIDEARLIVAVESDGGWVPLPNSTVDTVNHTVSAPITHFSDYVCTLPPDALGTIEGDFNGIKGTEVYSNNHGDPTPTTSPYYDAKDIYYKDKGNRGPNHYENGRLTGEEWQCVEYVTRFYWAVYNHYIRLSGQSNDATNFWNTAEARGLVKYPNRDAVKPQTGDIVVFEGVSRGTKVAHVAIVKSVTADKIYILQQNWFLNIGDADAYLSYNSTTNYLKTFKNDVSAYKVRGWLRLPTAQAPSLRVRVVNGIDVSRVAGATVVLGNPDGTIATSGTTDASGEITFVNPPANAIVTAAISGFDPVNPGKTTYALSAAYDVNAPAITLGLTKWPPSSSMGKANVSVAVPGTVTGLNSLRLMTFGGSLLVGTPSAVYPLDAYKKRDVQSDGKVSFVAMAADVNNAPVAYGSLLDQSFVDGMNANVTLDQTIFAPVTYAMINAPSALAMNASWGMTRKGAGGPIGNTQTFPGPIPASVTLKTIPNYGDAFQYQVGLALNQTDVYLWKKNSATFGNQSIDFGAFPSVPSGLTIAGRGSNTPTLSWATGDASADEAGVGISYNTAWATYAYAIVAPATRTSVTFPQLPSTLLAFVPTWITGFSVMHMDYDVAMGYNGTNGMLTVHDRLITNGLTRDMIEKVSATSW